MNTEDLMYIIKKMDEKLKEYMNEDEYLQFSKNIAREVFSIIVNKMAEGEFKHFIQDNFEEITGGKK